MISIRERDLTEEVCAKLIALSEDWEAENSCRGYRKNERADIEGNRIFLAEEAGETLGYLFGHVARSENMSSVMPEGTPFFEVEEVYIVPGRRSQGIGAELMNYAADTVKNEAEYLLLSTATKNWRAILHFYIDELGMEFWNARLFKKLH